jgi:cytochrome c nitrite reductase small subunit
MDPGRRGSIQIAVIAALALGLVAGLGAFTFRYAEGLSYFSADPRACVNCHIMRDQYASWQHSPHHAVATCVQCHLPHGFVSKWWAKAVNGWNHSKAFTLQDFPEPIRIGPRNAAILQENCLACHAEMVSELTHGSTTDEDAVLCVHCHRGVGHAARN